jgi:23S rRNA pseudouridine2605 synthase
LIATANRVGLARALSKLGLCSRAQAALLIRAGKVRVNGTVRRAPETPVRLREDRIEIDGESIAAAKKIYLVMNKPRGIVTTAADEKGRDTVYSLLGAEVPWVAPVGRLDKASEGLLLLTRRITCKLEKSQTRGCSRLSRMVFARKRETRFA